MPDDAPDPLTDFGKIPWFNVLDQTGWNELLEATQLRFYTPGEVVFLEGDRPELFYLVRRGWVKAVKLSVEGREQILNFLGPGQPINIAPVFAEQPSPATLIAQEACELWAIKQSTLLNLLDRYPLMARLLIRALADRLLHTIVFLFDLCSGQPCAGPIWGDRKGTPLHISFRKSISHSLKIYHFAR